MSNEIIHIYPAGKTNEEDIQFGNQVIKAGSLTLVKKVTRIKGDVQHHSLHFNYVIPGFNGTVIDSGFNDLTETLKDNYDPKAAIRVKADNPILLAAEILQKGGKKV